MFQNYKRKFTTTDIITNQDDLIYKLKSILEKDIRNENIKVRYVESVSYDWDKRDIIRVEFTSAPESISGCAVDEINKLGFQCRLFTVNGQYLFFEYLP